MDSRMSCFEEVQDEVPKFLKALGAVLDRIVERNDSMQGSTPETNLTVFHSLRAPGISASMYLERVYAYANCSSTCYILALVYLDRIMQPKAGVVITSLNAHRLIITSVMLAAKFFDDQ